MFFTPSFSSSLQTFPEEILLMIFSEADIPTLLSLSNVCKKFRRLANIYLVKKFKEQNVCLTLTFGQEHKLRSNVTMEFHHVNEKNGNFVFQPKEETIQLKYYQSPMINSPKLYKVFSPQNISKITTQKDGNLLQKSIGFSLKCREGIYQKNHYVYRTGHLKVPFEFIYSITDTPPSNDSKSRGGERWITPLSFECPQSFFYPNDTAVNRILKSMMNYKHTTKKQQSIKNPVVSNASENAKQKQRISFSQESQKLQIQEPTLKQRIPREDIIHEKKKLFMVPLVSSRRFNHGARC